MVFAVSLITWAVIIVGVIMILVSTLTFKRKGEAELSANVIETPLFKVGAIITVLGIVAKIITSLM